MLGIEDEGDVFEEFKANCVDGGSYEGSYGELCSKEIEACDYEGDEDSEYADGEVEAGEFTCDDAKAGGSIIKGVVGKEYAGNGEACHHGAYDNEDVGEENGVSFFSGFGHSRVLTLQKKLDLSTYNYISILKQEIQ